MPVSGSLLWGGVLDDARQVVPVSVDDAVRDRHHFGTRMTPQKGVDAGAEFKETRIKTIRSVLHAPPTLNDFNLFHDDPF